MAERKKQPRSRRKVKTRMTIAHGGIVVNGAKIPARSYERIEYTDGSVKVSDENGTRWEARPK